MHYFGSKKLKKVFNRYLINFEFSQNIAFGWGRKNSFFKAQAFAEKKHLSILCLEDGFIRSLGLGKEGYAPLSLVMDQMGIYFDAFHASDLENLIIQAEDQVFNLRAQAAIQTIVEQEITKYNQKFQPIVDDIFHSDQQHILVVDQTFGDQSIRYAGTDATVFKRMLQQACRDHPHAQIWVKTHPDVLAGKSKAHFSLADLNQPNIQVVSENYNPLALLKHMDEVYVVSSQLGFEALLCGKKVHCFAVPWYAGWGLTDDQFAPIEVLKNRRAVTRSLAHLFGCAYFKYARYISPITHQACELEEILQILTANIQLQQGLAQTMVAYGFSPWKKSFMRDYLAFPRLSLQFRRYVKPKKSDAVLAWGKKAHQLKQLDYTHVTTVEDGFIRSIGLGAALIRPCSLVFDDIGIYYDATRPSRIEGLLQNAQLTPVQYRRAENLRQSLVDLNISKYNVGRLEKLSRPDTAEKVLLVIGQVEDDMSVQWGGVSIKTNLDLLKQVRLNHPSSYIIYKPHPDVQAGLRVGKISPQLVLAYANQIEVDTSILECFEICDEVHTITSLSGFEALLRGIKVYCYGLPFYAGWGLTIDQFSCTRRTQQLDLETLIYTTLVDYAVYNIPDTKNMNIHVVQPEHVIAYIEKQLRFPQKQPARSWKNIFIQLRNLKNR